MKKLIYAGLLCATLSACDKPALVCTSRERNEVIIAKPGMLGAYGFTDSNGIYTELDGAESSRWECEAVTGEVQSNVN